MFDLFWKHIITFYGHIYCTPRRPSENAYYWYLYIHTWYGFYFELKCPSDMTSCSIRRDNGNNKHAHRLVYWWLTDKAGLIKYLHLTLCYQPYHAFIRHTNATCYTFQSVDLVLAVSEKCLSNRKFQICNWLQSKTKLTESSSGIYFLNDSTMWRQYAFMGD